MNIVVFSNFSKSQAAEITRQVCTFFAKKQITVYLENQLAKDFNCRPLSAVDPQKIDFCICIGGDGTILRFLHQNPSLTAPLLGINLGNLGYMADVRLNDLENSLQALLDKKYTIEKRLMLEHTVPGKDKEFAVNDIVIHRAQNPSLIELKITVDGKYFNTYRADGLIIATPTGSTAYSLSAGGPIITTNTHCIVLTPISPHTISNRPVICSPSSIIVECVNPIKPVEVTTDGISQFQMDQNHQLQITLSKQSFQTVSLNTTDNFQTLRTKLHWSGKLSLENEASY